MKIEVQRDIFTANSTTSKVYVNDSLFCYGLEDYDRRIECDPSCKVDGETAIPRGTYKVIVNFSQRFQKLMPQVVDVEGFSGVRIHPGNTKADTHGCLLVGTARDTDRVMNSRVAFDRLFDAIESALDRGQEVTIEYK
jgi:hypothetical protein